MNDDEHKKPEDTTGTDGAAPTEGGEQTEKDSHQGHDHPKGDEQK